MREAGYNRPGSDVILFKKHSYLIAVCVLCLHGQLLTCFGDRDDTFQENKKSPLTQQSDIKRHFNQILTKYNAR